MITGANYRGIAFRRSARARRAATLPAVVFSGPADTPPPERALVT
jgi:hypothetical protein